MERMPRGGMGMMVMHQGEMGMAPEGKKMPVHDGRHGAHEHDARWLGHDHERHAVRRGDGDAWRDCGIRSHRLLNNQGAMQHVHAARFHGPAPASGRVDVTSTRASRPRRTTGQITVIVAGGR